jgi:hypothetical protein
MKSTLGSEKYTTELYCPIYCMLNSFGKSTPADRHTSGIETADQPFPIRMNGAQWYGWGYSDLTCCIACCKASAFVLPQTNCR